MSTLMSTIAPDSMEAARRPLEAGQCALIVVDIQEKLLPPIFNKETMVKNAQLLIRLAKILSIPAMVTTQYSKGLGATVTEIAWSLGEVRTIDKLEFGCFGNDEFRSGLKILPGNRNTSAAVRHGSPHLRDPDDAGGAQRRIPSPRCLGRGGLALGVELEDRPRPHARRRCNHLFHRDDDVRTATLFGNTAVQGIAAVHKVGPSTAGSVCNFISRATTCRLPLAQRPDDHGR